MPQTNLSRRKFLITSAGAAGACALAYSGFNLLGENQPTIQFPEVVYGEPTMDNAKILVAYASQAGSTAEIAEAIGQTLAEGGAQVDVRRMKTVTDLSPYRAVVAGSAIHGSKWLPEAMQFMHTQQEALAQKPFAAFLVCITLGMANASNYRAGLTAWMEPVRSLVKPVSEGYFAGSLDFSKLPKTFNVLMLHAAVALGALPNGDHRDWNAIRTWAESLRPRLG
jgi:menaquinone-dependent protoporphyrinogen oxidase